MPLLTPAQHPDDREGVDLETFGHRLLNRRAGMAVPQNKRELLEAIRSSYQRLEANLASPDALVHE